MYTCNIRFTEASHGNEIVRESSREDELHEASYGDLLTQLALIGNQRRLRVQLRGIGAAQRVICVQIPVVEGVQHLPQPCVGAALQHLGLSRQDVSQS
jgi:hypothetical protein